MSDENKLCAEIYHLIYDRIDHSVPSRVKFCLDFPNAGAAIPDLELPLKDGKKIKIEVKVMDRKNWFQVSKLQFDSWQDLDDISWIIRVPSGKYNFIKNFLTGIDKPRDNRVCYRKTLKKSKSYPIKLHVSQKEYEFTELISRVLNSSPDEVLTKA